MVFIGKVISTDDPTGSERIKVRIKSADLNTADKGLTYAFPLLPKSLHVKPKEGEAVFVFCANDDPKQQRFYIGPIISQYQNMELDLHDGTALGTIRAFNSGVQPSVDYIPESYGSFGTNDDVAIYGRKNTDIILSENDMRIRCGARLLGDDSTTRIAFNRKNPSLIKLKYYDGNGINVQKKVWNDVDGEFSKVENENVESAVSIIGQEINLISTAGSPYVNTSTTEAYQNGNESLSDKDLLKFIKEAHPLPYGDVLIKFLYILVDAFVNHTHKYTQDKPVKDATMMRLEKFTMDSILSKNVRIN